MQVSMLVGKAAMLNKQLESAIDKQRICTPQFCDFDGLAADTQVSTQFHGGRERALHYYPQEHYPYWQTWFQSLGLSGGVTRPLTAGGFGENIAGLGLLEGDACIGDIYRLDQALVQISQPRSPCYKLNTRFGCDFFSVLVQANGRTGWLLRVLETGWVNPSANLTLVDRPHPEMSVKRASDIVYNQTFSAENLAELAALTVLSQSWRQKAEDYLAAGQITDWRMRLLGPV